jgi:chromosome segregation ATPase
MATNNQIKFYKGQNAPAAPAAGMIWFSTLDRTIRVYTGAEWEKYAGLVDASWNDTDKKLVITNAAGTTTTLNLSDMASASGVAAQIQTINTNVSKAQAAAEAAQSAAEGAQAAAEAADAKAVKEAEDRAKEITRVEGLISAEAATARAAEEANAKAAKAADDKAAGAQSYAEGVNTALGQEVTRATGEEARIAGLVSAEESRAKGVEDELRGLISSAASGATTEVAKAANATHITVTSSTGDNGQKIYTIGESDIASAQSLADEIADRAVDEQAIIDRIALLDAAETGRVSVLEEQVRALNAATHFEGKVEGESFEAAISASGKTFEAGDIVIYGNKEYIYDGSAWIELGDTTAEQGRISALEGLVGSTSVDSQIDSKIAGLDATAGTTTVADGKHVAVEVVEVDGKLTAVNVGEKDIASAAKLSEIEGEVDLNTGAVADHKTRIEALEATKNALDSTYVKVSNYSVDKAALQGEIDAAEGRLDTAEGDIDTLQAAIERLDGEQDSQDQAIAAADAKGAQGIADAATALAKANEKVASVSAGNDYVSVGGTSTVPTVSVNVTGDIADGNTGLVTGGKVFEALCWVEFE